MGRPARTHADAPGTAERRPRGPATCLAQARLGLELRANLVFSSQAVSTTDAVGVSCPHEDLLALPCPQAWPFSLLLVINLGERARARGRGASRLVLPPAGLSPFSALSCCFSLWDPTPEPPCLLEASSQPWLFPVGRSGRDGQDAPHRAQSTRCLHLNPAADRPPAVSSEQGPRDTGAWAPPPPPAAPALGAIRATSVPGWVLPAGVGRCEGRGTACRGGVDVPRGRACAPGPNPPTRHTGGIAKTTLCRRCGAPDSRQLSCRGDGHQRSPCP